MKNSNSGIAVPLVDTDGWFRNWFDTCFYHKLYSSRDENEAAAFIDELLRELQPAAASEMLDLGCGAGRHSKYLASKGFFVTGIDLASSSIQYAKKWGSPALRFHRHDMRSSFGEDHFDYVFSFFTSFGYFETDEEDHQVIGNIRASLKTGGTLVMDYINTRFAEKKTIAFEEKEIDGIVYYISRWTDEKYFFKKIVVEDMRQGKPLEYIERVRKFSLEEFDLLFETNGLHLENVYGDYQLGEYDSKTSPRLILIARKH